MSTEATNIVTVANQAEAKQPPDPMDEIYAARGLVLEAGDSTEAIIRLMRRAEKAEGEAAAILAWAILHTDEVCLSQIDEGVWQAMNEDANYVFADTPEAAIRKAAGLGEEIR